MEQRSRIEKQPEGTAKPTRKAGKAGLGPWHYSQYKYQEQTDNQRVLYGDPREKCHGQHPDSNFTPSDEESDYQSLHPASGFGTTPDLYASDPSAGDQGSLAGDLRDALQKTEPQAKETLYAWGTGTRSRFGKAGIVHQPGTSRTPMPDNWFRSKMCQHFVCERC
jgi:hypothetical protein